MPSETLKHLARTLFGDYECWKILYLDLPATRQEIPQGMEVVPVDSDSFAHVADAQVRRHMQKQQNYYTCEQSQGYVLYANGEPVATQWCLWGDGYWRLRRGHSWPIPSNAAKSMGLYTAPAHRGKGYAVILKQQVAQLMFQKGFTRLYCRIWHSHKSSLRVSRKARWRNAGLYVAIYLANKRIDIRIPWRIG